MAETEPSTSPRTGLAPAWSARGLWERERELRTLHEAVTGARDGAGSHVVISGPAGIGKSDLLAATADFARERGMAVLAGRGIELERDAPFGVAGTLFAGALATSAKERARLLAGPARLAGPVVDEGASRSADLHAVVRALYWLTVGLTAAPARGARRPLLVLVDDVQWVDHASVAFLAYLAARVGELPVAVVIAERSGDPDVVDHAPGGFPPSSATVVLRPEPLSDHAVGEIVASELPGADRAFGDACARVTRGNPFLVRELTRALRADEVVPTAASVAQVDRLVPASVLQSVLVRIARLGVEPQHLAEAVAVLGDGASLRHAATLAELDPRRAELAADLLARADVLDAGEPLRFTHPLVATAVASDLPAFARARAHRRSADLLAADGASPERVAAHLLLTRPEGDDAIVSSLRRAAERVLAAGDPVAAKRFLERAVVEPPAREVRVEVLLELAEAQLHGGDVAAERTLDEVVALVDDGPELVRASVALARFHFNRGDHRASAEAYERALAGLEPSDPGAEQLLAEYLTAHTFDARLRPVVQDRLGPLVTATEQGRPPGSPGLLAHLALQTAFAGGRPAEVRALAELATVDEPLVDAGSHGFLTGMLVQALVCVDELEVAEQLADAALGAAQRNGSLLAYTLASYHRAIPRHHLGALVPALGDLAQALEATAEGWSGGAWVFAQQTHTHLELGDISAARDSLALARVRAPDSMDHAVVAFARARVALATGNALEALDSAESAGEVLLAGFEIDHAGFIPWRETAALAALGVGNRERAQRLAAEALDRARALDIPRVVSTALRAVAAVSPDIQRIERLEEAVAILEGRPDQLERAHVLVALGAALRHAGHTAPAQSVLREGFQLADAMGARPLADAARAELRATGARPRRAASTGADALTPTERRVAELAATGLTNARIAQDLFVTTKTVETHLASAYRKLGIRSRQELRAALHTPPRSPD